MSTAEPARTTDHVTEALRTIVSDICGLPLEDLPADQQVADLDIDSVFAAEIVARIERDLNVDIDIRKILNDWSSLTLHGLAVQIADSTAG